MTFFQSLDLIPTNANFVITQPANKIGIWSRKAKIGLIEVLHNGNDANLVITWSRNPLAKTSIPGKPSKSSLIEVWHKNNLYLGTSTIGNGDPHPTNIDSRTRSIRMRPRRQLFFDKSIFSSLENQGREIIPPTQKQVRQKKFIDLKIV